MPPSLPSAAPQPTKLLGSSKGRSQVLNFRSMYIMADLGQEGDAANVGDKVRSRGWRLVAWEWTGVPEVWAT